MKKVALPLSRSSRLSFYCEGRLRRIYKPRPGANYHVRFQVKGKDYPRSLGVSVETQIPLAIAKAKVLIVAAHQGDAETLSRTKLRSEYALLSALEEPYLRNYGTTPERRKIAKGNLGALRKMVDLAGPFKYEAARSSVLDDGLVRRFEEAELKRIVRSSLGYMEPQSELQVRTSLESVITQARAVFRRSHMSWFDGLVFPDLSKFREQGFTRPVRPKPQRLDMGVMEAIEADAPRLRREAPAIYAAFLLFSQAGLRNREIKFARRTWLHRQADGSGAIDIRIRHEENFIPKKGTEGVVPISGPVLEELLRIAEQDEEGYLVPATSKTERAKVVDRRHSEWVGQWIKERSKTSYELRRYAGSLYFQQVRDITKVQRFLRHRDLATTMKWYWYDLQDLQPLAAPAWMTQPLRVVA